MSNPDCHCGAPMRLKETSRFKTKDGLPKKFWACTRYPECKGTIGAHPDGTPLGFPVDSETKRLRHELHEILNRFWNYNILEQRRDMYAFLARETRTGHIGQMTKDELIELKIKLLK